MRDVVVVGGGPVGVFTAALLAQQGLDVSVWEKRVPVSTSSRAIGIHPPSLDLFERLGVADAVVRAAVRINRGIAKSGGKAIGAVSFAGVSDSYPFVAALPQFATEALLARRLDELAPDAVRRGVEVKALDDLSPDVVRLHGRGPDGDVFETARFVVGADGARSTVRRLLGIEASLTAYPDPFVMGDFRDDTADGDDAVIHLEAAGVVESFPLPGGLRRYVVNAGAAALPGRPTAESVASLVNARVGDVVDPATNSMVSGFVTRRRLADGLVRGRTVLIGDAAHEISPIGGQGMTLGWLDAADLVPLLTAAVAAGHPDPVAFDAFQERRMRVARRAARQAETNMAMGRPTSNLRHGMRNASLGLLLASPASRMLARTYAMSWSS